MSDGDSGSFKGAVAEVVKDTGNAFKDMGQQAVESVAGGNPTPQQQAQKQQDQQTKKVEAAHATSYWRKVLAEQQKVFNQKLQAEQQRKQQPIVAPSQQTQTAEQQQASKQPGANIREDIALTQGERRAGRGSGG